MWIYIYIYTDIYIYLSLSRMHSHAMRPLKILSTKGHKKKTTSHVSNRCQKIIRSDFKSRSTFGRLL